MPVQPRTQPGVIELLSAEQIAFQRMLDTVQLGFERFGYLPVETAVLGLTAQLLTKSVGEHEHQLNFPFRRYQIQRVYLGDGAQKGRFREFYQCDIDVIGKDTLPIAYDAEVPSVIYGIFEELAFGKFQIRINNRKLLRS